MKGREYTRHPYYQKFRCLVFPYRETIEYYRRQLCKWPAPLQAISLHDQRSTPARKCKLKFETQGDLENHQRKFCVDSDYGNATKLERRLLNLGQKDPKVSLGMNEIKQYLRGEDPTVPNKGIMGEYNLNELRDYFQNGKLQQDEAQRRSLRKKDFDQIDQMKDIKKEKHLMRMRKDQDEEDLVQLLKDLEMRKERELRAQIEKEEIQRNLKDLDKKQLSAMERERKKELERLAVERENLRVKEQQIMDDVKKMEQQLLEQEKFFRKQKDEYGRDPNKEFMGNDIRSKEMQLAKDRGQKIVQIKAQRDRLEKERERILDDLNQVKQGNLPNRRNEAARLVGDQMFGNSRGFQDNDKYNVIEPSLKDKLINDTVRVNYLREQQRKTLNEMMPEIDEIDILQKEMENRNFANDAQRLVNEIDGRMTPNKPLYLGTIRQNLENQAAAPSSYNPMNNNYQADLPSHIPQGEGKGVLINNVQSLKDEYLMKGGEDNEFLNKINELENFLMFKKKLPPKQPQGPSQMPINEITINQPPPFMPPVGFPGPMGMGGMPPQPFPPFPGGAMGMPPMPGMPPPYDPMLNQMNTLLQQQEQENQRLREALEGIGSGAGTYKEFDNIINQTSNELEQLKSRILPGGAGGIGLGGLADDEEFFPEDFVFRQNEFRCEDLEVEERALMNLASQEYDALRVISKLPVNSELYRYKMDQYKEISTMRAEIEKVLQEQRLEKIRRDFEKQKYEDERRFKHEKWLEEQKRQILEAKLKNAGRNQDQGDYFEPNYQMPPQTNDQNQYQKQQPDSRRNSQQSFNQMQQQPPPMTQNSQGNYTPKTNKSYPQQSYDPHQGFILCIDYLFNLMREYKQIRLVYSIFQDKKSMIEPRQIEMKYAEADYENPSFNKVFFNASQIVKHVKQHPSANLIIELQVPDPVKNDKFQSLGWTILNVFDPQYNINKGRWRLPIYRPPTVLDLDIRDINRLSNLQTLVTCIRICMPKDDVFNFQPNARTKPNQYMVPQCHQIQKDNPQFQKEKTLPQKKDQQPNNRQKPDRNDDEREDDGIKNRDPNYECQGLQVFLHYLRNLKDYFKAKVQVTLYEGTQIVKQDNYEDCNWATNSIEKANNQLVAPKGSKIEIGLDGQINIIKDQREVVKPREYGNNQIAQINQGDELILAVNQDIFWQRDLYNMIWDHNIKDNLFLLIQVFVVSTQQPNNYNMGPNNPGKYEPYGYTVFTVNNDDGTIKYGTYEQPLYTMPINLYKQERNTMLPGNIKFSLVQPKTQPLSVKNQLPTRARQDSQGRPISTQFIPNFDKQWTPSEDYAPGDGIDVYVDWARHLPDNTMFSKVFVRVIDQGMTSPIPGQKGFASIDFSTARNPFFGFKYEVRGAKFNPSLLVFVSFETVDRSNGEPRFAGHSFFPLFMDKVSLMPITDPNARNYTIHKGFYQMPVYCQHPNMSSPFTYENFIYLERVPTASMLIRIYKAPRTPDGKVLGLDTVPQDKWADSQVLIQAPVYQEGVYNTQYYRNTALENKLFYIRKKRKDPKLATVLDSMLQIFKYNPSQFNEDQKLDLVDKIINVPVNAPMIDMNYFSSFDPDIGFRVGVEAIHKNNEKAFFCIMMSVCPNASYYSGSRGGPPSDMVSFTAQDWESNTHTLKFTEGQFNLQSVKPFEGVSLIFDIKKFVVGRQKFEDYGYALFPLFDVLETDEDKNTTELYINSGIYSLPVYKGGIEQPIIQALRQSNNPFQLIQQLYQAGKLSPMTPTSIIVKVVDNQRERHFDKGFEQIAPRNRFLPPEILNQLTYQQTNNQSVPKGAVKLAQMLPEGETIVSFQQFLTDYFSSQYRI